MKLQLMGLTALALALTGCGGGLLTSSQKTPTAYYLLHPSYQAQANTPPRAMAQNATVLRVERPDVPAGFDTDRIALYLNGGRRLDYYADARWPERLDTVLQEFTTASLRGAFPDLVVDTNTLDVPTDYRLAVKIIHFEPIYGSAPAGAPLLRTEILYTLISRVDETVLAQFTVTQEAQARSDDLSSITAGLEALLQQTQREAFPKLAPYLTGRKPAAAETPAT